MKCKKRFGSKKMVCKVESGGNIQTVDIMTTGKKIDLDVYTLPNCNICDQSLKFFRENTKPLQKFYKLNIHKITDITDHKELDGIMQFPVFKIGKKMLGAHPKEQDILHEIAENRNN